MAQPNRNEPRTPQTPVPPPNAVPIDGETVKNLIAQQSQKLALEASKVRLDEKRIEADVKLAEQSMTLNASILKDQPKEQRKTVTTYAWIIGIFFLLIAGFVVSCLALGKDDFIVDCLKGLKDLAIAIVSFLIGRKTVGKQDEKGPTSSPGYQDAEVVD